MKRKFIKRIIGCMLTIIIVVTNTSFVIAENSQEDFSDVLKYIHSIVGHLI